MRPIHAAQMQSARIFVLDARCLAEFVRDLFLSLANNDAHLALGLPLLGLAISSAYAGNLWSFSHRNNVLVD